MGFYSARSLKQQFADRYVTPLKTHHPDSEPTRLLFLLIAACFAEKQQIPIL